MIAAAKYGRSCGRGSKAAIRIITSKVTPGAMYRYISTCIHTTASLTHLLVQARLGRHHPPRGFSLLGRGHPLDLVPLRSILHALVAPGEGILARACAAAGPVAGGSLAAQAAESAAAAAAAAVQLDFLLLGVDDGLEVDQGTPIDFDGLSGWGSSAFGIGWCDRGGIFASQAVPDSEGAMLEYDYIFGRVESFSVCIVCTYRVKK